MSGNKMFQVSTLQALALGYSRAVVNAGELMRHGDIGLGTFEDVNGEMIVLDGHCYRADEKGNVSKADDETGVPFSSPQGGICISFRRTERREVMFLTCRWRRVRHTLTR